MKDARPAAESESALQTSAFRRSASRLLFAVAVALTGAGICVWIRTPLPWLIGPLVAVALVSMTYRQVEPPPAARQAGQWAIGVALGLYFSPEVVREVVRLAPWLLAAVDFAIALGALGAWMLCRMARVDTTTSFFATAIGGASENGRAGAAPRRTRRPRCGRPACASCWSC